jgi:polyisoprenoid-binding protein YceI
MKKVMIKTVMVAGMFFMASFTNVTGKLVSKKTNVEFLSHTEFEDIKASNFKSVSTLEVETGEIVFSVPMQSFEFEKSLMQKHFNSPKFLDTKQFPKAKFVGKIVNLSDIHFDHDGVYHATVKGEMNLHGESKQITENATISIKGTNVEVKSKFKLTLADYKVAFEKGKPAKNIAKTVEVDVQVEF